MELFYCVNLNMQVLGFIFIIHFIIAQDFTWEALDGIPEGYNYVIDSNDNGDLDL